jgi:hypothetical protein
MNEDYKNKTIGELRKLNLSLTELCFDLKLLENNKSIFENTRYVFENFEKSIKEPLKKFRDSIDAFKNRNPIFIVSARPIPYWQSPSDSINALLKT